MKKNSHLKKNSALLGWRAFLGKPCRRKGSFLVEGTIALFLLVSIAFALLQSTMAILKPRTYTIYQNMADAYLSVEVASANRIDFDAISTDGQYPLYPASARTQVVIGKLPITQADVTADVIRTRMPYTWTATGADALDFGTLGIQVWKLQSHLVYTIDGQEYVKSRTVIRSQ